MAETSSLFANHRDGSPRILFEGNNPLPFFWLMLLDETDVETYRRKLEASTSGQLTNSTAIRLPKLKAIACAADRRDFIKQYYPGALALFDDWLFYLQRTDFPDTTIYLDLHSTSLCYPTTQAFIQSLQKAINGFDRLEETWYEENVPNTCGYAREHDRNKPFADLSQAYGQLIRTNRYGVSNERFYLNKRPPMPQRWQLALVALLIGVLIASILFFTLR